MMAFRFPLLGALATLALFSVGQSAQAQPPSLSFMMPAAVVPGQPTDLILYGGALEGAAAVWASFPAQAELTPGIEGNGTQGGQVSFRITVPAETPLGVGGLRVVTGRGVSEVRLVAIDSLPTVAENGTNKTPEAAQAVTLPVAVDGAAEPESFDYYQLDAVKGQRVSVEVLAQRLGSPLDPVVRLLDGAGNELAYSDDEAGLGADGRFSLEVPADGRYLIEVRDIRYHGSGGHRYRLRIGDFPLVSVAYPLAVSRGSVAQVALVGPQAPADTVAVTAPAEASGPMVRASLSGPAAQGASWVALLLSSAGEAVEFEPNDAPEAASPAALGGGLNGRLAKPGDRDWYQFAATAGQRWTFTGQTRTLGSPTDLFLRLYKEDGTLLAEVDDTGPAEGVLDFTFPADGNYRLMVEDLHRRGGPEHAYRVAIDSYQPGFSLAVETDRFNAPQGGVFVGKVTSARRDYAGPITLSLEGAPAGTTLVGNVIAENANETVLRATLPPTATAGQWAALRVVGQATIGERAATAVASNLPALKTLLAGLPNPPAELEGALALGIGPAFPEFLKLTIDGGAVPYGQLTGAATFKVKAEKLHGFDDVIGLGVEGLPPGYSVEVKNIEKGQAEVELALKGPLAPAPGEFKFRIVGTATLSEQPGRAVAEVAVRVIPPLRVALTVPGPLVAGQTVPVKITVTRFAGSTAPVTLRWERLPLGVTGAAEMVLGEGQTELETPLTAAADAMLGANPLVLSAASTVAGREIRAASDPAALEVKMP